MELSSTLTNLETINASITPKVTPDKSKSQIKEALNERDRAFYAELNEALNKDETNAILETLKGLNQRAATQVATHIIELLQANKNGIGRTENNISIRYNNLDLITIPKHIFVTYIIFIAKAVETIMGLVEPTKPLSIFSDYMHGMFNNQLMVFLLISSLDLVGYKSIEINLLTVKPFDLQPVEQLLGNIKGLAAKINVHKSVQDLISSGKKIDLYVSNGRGLQADGFKCTTKNNKSAIYAQHSNQENIDYLISTKTDQLKEQADRNVAFGQLIKALDNTTKKAKFDSGDYTCSPTREASTYLADVIFYTRRPDTKKIPLLELSVTNLDTGTGIVDRIAIIKALLKFDNYEELFFSLFKADLALRNKNFDQLAVELELFKNNRNTQKFDSVNENLNATKADIEVFMREDKRLAPSVIKT